jgi:hypothetical protein
MLRRMTLAALLVLAVAPAAASATSTLVVDDDGAQCPDAGFTSLATAITYAQSHDTIQVCAGTYITPSTGLKIDKTLTIHGAGASKVTIQPPSATTLGNGNYADATGSVVTVTNTAPGSTSDTDVNPTISGVTIVDNGDTVDAGITFDNAAGTITASTIGPLTGTGSGWGVVASNNEAVTPFGAFVRDVTVSGNKITGYGKGGVLVDGSESSKAFYFRSGIPTAGAITGNVITGHAGPAQQYGVQVNAGARAVITGNQIAGNVGTVAGTATTPGSGVGILLTDADVTSTVLGSPTKFYTSIGSNNLTGNGYGIFNGTPDFADGPVGAPADAPLAPPAFPYATLVNGTAVTPASTQLPATLHNTTMSVAGGISVDNGYDVAGAAVQGATSAANWYGSASGPLRGQPSAGGVDAISAATTAPTDNDSVIAGSARATAFAAPTAPAVVVDALPSAAWGSPTASGGLTAGAATRLLVKATDDFGVQSVHVTAGADDLGTLTHTPYAVSYTPAAGLIGTSITLTAVVTDEAGQTKTVSETLPVAAPPAPPRSDPPPAAAPTDPVAQSTPPTSTVVPLPFVGPGVPATKATTASIASTAKVTGRVAALAVTCSSGHVTTCSVAVKVTAKVGGKTVTIGTKTVKVTHGHQTTVKITLNAAGRKALAAAKHHKLTTTVQITVAGRAKTVHVTLTGH